VSTYQRERETLGVRLRELRKRSGMTGVEFAHRLGWAQSKVSRLELGKQTAAEADIEAWVQATGAPNTLAEELWTLLRSIDAEYVTWKRDLRIGVRTKQRAFLGLEARVRSIRGFETCVVPGLLQTAEYARHRIAEMPALHHIPEDIEQALAIRMQRQHSLYDPSKNFHFVLSEAVLRSRLCPPHVLAGQLDRLLAVSSLDNLKLGIIPFTARLPYAPLNQFWIFDDDLITFETFAAEIHLRDPDEIALYINVFDKLVDAAVYDHQARQLISTVLDELRNEKDLPK
jgi:transcriptional regulator with XRE-family HTH domain